MLALNKEDGQAVWDKQFTIMSIMTNFTTLMGKKYEYTSQRLIKKH